MNPDDALRRVLVGGTFVCTDVPIGTQFGLDMEIHTTGKQFMGMKMLAPDQVHLVHTKAPGGDMGPAACFFFFCGSGEVCVRRWSKEDECIDPSPLSDLEQHERIVGAVRRMELDGNLAAYPQGRIPQWWRITNMISRDVIAQLGLDGAKVISSSANDEAELESTKRVLSEVQQQLQEEEGAAAPSAKPRRSNKLAQSATMRPTLLLRGEHDLLGMNEAPLPPAPGCTPLRELLHVPKSTVGADLTMACLDRTGVLEAALARLSTSGSAAEEQLLGELQVVFLLFLMGDSLAALEHWKLMVHVFCTSERAILTHATLMAGFARTLRRQLEHIPEDLFVDPMTASNFLRQDTRVLMQVLSETDGVPRVVERQCHKLCETMKARFGFDPRPATASLVGEGEWEDDEDAPVVVDLNE